MSLLKLYKPILADVLWVFLVPSIVLAIGILSAEARLPPVSAMPPDFLLIAPEHATETHVSVVVVDCTRAPTLGDVLALTRLAMRYVKHPERSYKLEATIDHLVQSRLSASTSLMDLMSGSYTAELHNLECFDHELTAAAAAAGDEHSLPNATASCLLLANMHNNYEAFVARFQYVDAVRQEEGDGAQWRYPMFDTVVLLIKEPQAPQFHSWPYQPDYLPLSVSCLADTVGWVKFADGPNQGRKVVNVKNHCPKSPLGISFWSKWAQAQCPNYGIFTIGWTAQSEFNGIATTQVAIPVQDFTAPQFVDPATAKICIISDYKKTNNFASVRACPARFVDAWVRHEMVQDNCDGNQELSLIFTNRTSCNHVTLAKEREDVNIWRRRCESEIGDLNRETVIRQHNRRHEFGPNGGHVGFAHDDEVCDFASEGSQLEYLVSAADLCGNENPGVASVILHFVAQQGACFPDELRVPFDERHIVDAKR